jgi:hypothetical protein
MMAVDRYLQRKVVRPASKGLTTSFTGPKTPRHINIKREDTSIREDPMAGAWALLHL